MGRENKNKKLKINNSDSLEGLMQETYQDICLQINQAQDVINELSTASQPEDVDDLTKIASVKGSVLKLKESGIKIKLDLARLQFDMIKNAGNNESTSSEKSYGAMSIRELKTLKENFNESKLLEEMED